MNNSLQNLCFSEAEISKYYIKEEILKYKVSVIIPVFNTEKFLYKCLASVVCQSIKEIEIIVVNDGSTDNSEEIIKQFANADTRFKLINQENLKQGAARNNGMKYAKGEYIGFIDSDDWVDLDYFEKLYAAAKKYNSDIALATNVRVGNGKTKKRLNIKKEEFAISLQDKINISNQAKNPCPTNKIYRLKMLKENNITYREGVYCEDKLFTIQSLYYANGIVSVPDINYYYFRNPNSTVNTKLKKHVKKADIDKNNAKRAVLNFLKEKNVKIQHDEFWAIKKEFKLFNVTLLKIEENLSNIKIKLFGIEIFNKPAKNPDLKNRPEEH